MKHKVLRLILCFVSSSLLAAELPNGFVDSRHYNISKMPYYITGVTLVLLIIIGILISRYIKRKVRIRIEEANYISPYDLAKNELKPARELMISGSEKKFTITVSNILRRYIEDQFNMPASESTTEEFLPLAVKHPLIQGSLADRLSSFLQQCDLVKFARQNIEQENMEELYVSAESFIEKSYSKSRQYKDPELINIGR